MHSNRSSLIRRLFQGLVLALASVFVLSACDLLFPPPEETCETNETAENCFPNTPDPDPDTNPDAAANFTLSSAASPQEAQVGESLTFTFTVENLGDAAGEASLSVPAVEGFDGEGLDVSLTLEPGKDNVQTITGTVLETAGESLVMVATLNVPGGKGNSSKPTEVKVIRDTTPPVPDSQGAVILTFDDNVLGNWLTADEKLAAYDWQATFFISGGLDDVPTKGAGYRELQDKGHEIGAHTVTHTSFAIADKTVEQYIEDEVLPNLALLEAESLDVSSFAYANGASTAALDDALLETFTNLRGIAPSSASARAGRFYATEPGKVDGLSIDERSSSGTEGSTSIDYILEALEEARDSDRALVMYGHDIVDGTVADIENLGLTFDRLEQIVKYASENDMAFITLSELETWQAGQ